MADVYNNIVTKRVRKETLKNVQEQEKVLTALMLCITMIITMIPAAAFAEDEVVKYQLYIGGKQTM